MISEGKDPTGEDHSIYLANMKDTREDIKDISEDLVSTLTETWSSLDKPIAGCPF